MAERPVAASLYTGHSVPPSIRIDLANNRAFLPAAEAQYEAARRQQPSHGPLHIRLLSSLAVGQVIARVSQPPECAPRGTPAAYDLYAVLNVGDEQQPAAQRHVQLYEVAGVDNVGAPVWGQIQHNAHPSDLGLEPYYTSAGLPSGWNTEVHIQHTREPLIKAQFLGTLPPPPPRDM